MRWQLAHGDTAQKNVEALQKRGAPIPKHLIPPDLIEGLSPWYLAFWELSTERRFAGAPIPLTAIQAWPVDDDERGLFHRLMRAMDREYIDHLSSKDKAQDLAPGMIKGKRNG